MRRIPGTLSTIMLLALVLFTGTGARGAAHVAQVPTATGGFIPNGGSVNTPPPGGSHPSIALGHLVASDAIQPWIAFANGNDVTVSRFDGSNWQQQGAALNAGTGNPASQPAITFAGANSTTPWVAFAETVGGTGQIMASSFNGSIWQAAGSSLNRSATADAANPHLASAATQAASDPQPWLAWDEATSSGRRVFVSTIAGNVPQPAGDAINYNAARSSVMPDIAIAGTTPWSVWVETGGGETSKIFAAQAIADNTATGGWRWSVVGQQASCASAATCTLNVNPNRDAGAPRIASGMLATETTAAPWLVFTQQSSAGVDQIYVARFDGGRFRFVSGSLNVDPAQAASSPVIFFVGNVPHVAWTEQQNGSKRVFARHLGSVAPGQERWDLNTDTTGLTRTAQSTSDPAIGSNGNTPFLAWSEGGSAPTIFSARRFPDGPAWGRNYPPFIRVISGTFRLARSATLTSNELRQHTQADVIGDPVVITSSCDHVNGWDAISEIQFKLANDQETIFLGRYIAATNQIVVMDPANPTGVPIGSGAPGSAGDIETSDVILHLAQTSITSFDSNAAALDVHWSLSFKRATLAKSYAQAINIVYNAPSSAASTQASTETGFSAPALLSSVVSFGCRL